MSNLNNKTVLVADYGLFTSTAVTLAKSFGTVLYYCPWKGAYPGSNRLLIGDGLPGVTRVRDFFDHLDADLFFFPDLGDGDLQQHLRSIGKRVWGTGKAEELENFRWRTKQLMDKIGLPTQPVKRVVGLDALKRELQSRDNLWIKTSTMRADMETWHHLNWELSKRRVAELEWKLGAKGKYFEFIIEDDIPDADEEGYDGWSIDGGFPDKAMLGFEIKGAGLVGKIMPYSEFPDTARLVNEKLSPILKQLGCRGSFSTEIRNGVLIDPCVRQPSPPSELYPEMYSNFAECVWHGANGEIISPEVVKPFGVEITIESDWSENNPLDIQYPPEIEPWVKLRNNCRIDGVDHIVALKEGPRIGAVVGVGDTLKEACLAAMKHAKAIEGFHVESNYDSVAKGLKTIASYQEKTGLKITDEPIPTEDELEAEIEKA